MNYYVENDIVILKYEKYRKWFNCFPLEILTLVVKNL
jgi:uncharacterized CHY-type Zn-finger protein